MDSNRVLLMWDELPLFNHLSWKHLFCMRYQLSLPQLKIELTWRCCVKLWHKLINELLLFATVRNSEISRFWHNLHTLICSITRVAAVCGSKKNVPRYIKFFLCVTAPGTVQRSVGKSEILLSSTSVFFRQTSFVIPEMCNRAASQCT